MFQSSGGGGRTKRLGAEGDRCSPDGATKGPILGTPPAPGPPAPSCPGYRNAGACHRHQKGHPPRRRNSEVTLSVAEKGLYRNGHGSWFAPWLDRANTSVVAVTQRDWTSRQSPCGGGRWGETGPLPHKGQGAGGGHLLNRQGSRYPGPVTRERGRGLKSEGTTLPGGVPGQGAEGVEGHREGTLWAEARWGRGSLSGTRPLSAMPRRCLWRQKGGRARLRGSWGLWLRASHRRPSLPSLPGQR